jgi:RNA polymerase sigma factor (sigma-70 family)
VSPEVNQLVDHLFRREAGKMVAMLTHVFGLEHLQVAEDAMQEALLTALRTWGLGGVPRNPSAWLMRVAKNRALDIVRRETNFRSKEKELTVFFEQRRESAADSVRFDEEIRDDQLRLIFACCHPDLPPEAQVALTLKTLCGFGEREIAAAFLTSGAAIAKRLVRARQRIREAPITLDIPAGPKLAARLDAVLQTLYLLFNEGYKASHGDDLVRMELCDEAIRLAGILVDHPVGDRPKTHALLALMLLNAARLSARADAEGNMLLLAEQDRGLWNRAIIARGMGHLNQSAAGKEISEFHLQAGIAYCHCAALTYEATDWRRILLLYDMLTEIDRSPVVALNRAVVISNVQGPEAALDAIGAISLHESLSGYYLYHAVVAHLRYTVGDFKTAAIGFRRAIELTDVTSEQAFLRRRLGECEKRNAEIENQRPDGRGRQKAENLP